MQLKQFSKKQEGKMRYGSVCSGVEAATLAWHSLGWQCKFVSEVEPFPCAVLQERLGASAPINPLAPEDATDDGDRKMRESWIKQNEFLKKEGVLPNEGDFTKIGKKYAGKIDLLVGGTPCQDLSVAGKRAGFDGERSSLAIDFVRLAYESKCKWFVWENVPGVFSSNGGRDFATLLSLFTGTEVGVPKKGWGTAGFVCNARRDRYGVAWRTLDGQFTRASGFPFAVPQRRRRVFLVGYFGDWSRAAEVLLEPGRVCWNTPARRVKGSKSSGTAKEFCSDWCYDNQTYAREPSYTGDVCCTLQSHIGTGGNTKPIIVSFALAENIINRSLHTGGNGSGYKQDIAYTQNTAGVMGVSAPPHPPRMLLPIECERLMGFPDNWTRIPWKGKSVEDCPDSPRYKACGNSMCVNVMRWIGEQIQKVEEKYNAV
jgi:DNA (cytosine-5)-methyltransferase 1